MGSGNKKEVKTKLPDNPLVKSFEADNKGSRSVVLRATDELKKAQAEEDAWIQKNFKG